jgi:tetratricopeptide (TPR) repeat protein
VNKAAMSEKPAAVEMDEMDMDMDDDEAYVRPVSAQKPVASAPVLRGLPSRQPSTAPAQPSKPLTKVEQLRQKIKNDLYDSDAWNQLVLEYQNRPIAEARETYEEFLRVFPTAGRWWKYYAEQEISARNFDAAEKVFMRCLPSCPSVDLWKSYMKYVLDHKSKLPNSKDVRLLLKVYELLIYALRPSGLH